MEIAQNVGFCTKKYIKNFFRYRKISTFAKLISTNKINL